MRKDCTVTSWPVHVVPLYDTREHEVDMHCWCNPTLDIDEDGSTDVFVHHSADGREAFEHGQRTPS